MGLIPFPAQVPWTDLSRPTGKEAPPTQTFLQYLSSLDGIIRLILPGGALPIPVASGGTGYVGGAWTPFTATLDSTTGGSTFTQGGSASFLQIGKIVFFNASVTITALGGGPADVRMLVPVAPVRQIVIVGRDTATTGFQISLTAQAGATKSLVLRYNNNVAVTPAVGDQYTFDGVYEAA